MLRKFFVAVPITVLCVGTSTACATKKFVRTSVGEVNEKVDSQGRAIEETQERTRRNEGRISEVETKLANAQIIDPRLHDADGRVVFGATVDLEDKAAGSNVTWQIVGEDEADIKSGKISISSPIARSLIGKYAGDEVEAQTPGGVKRYEIIDVRYE